MRTQLSLLFALYFAQCLPAYANYDTRTVFKKGDWEVDLIHDPSDGQLWCTAKTSNSGRQGLNISFFDTGAIVFTVYDDKWQLSNRSVDFLVDIDYSRWNVTGEADGSGIYVNIADKVKAAEFLAEISLGNAVAVYNNSERRLATFSLSGSRAAIRSLIDCWKSISSNDPFRESSGSSRQSADPFD